MTGAPLPPGCGLLVVGHGTADPVGAAETLEVARLAAALVPGVAVEAGFLEVIEPSIAVAVERLAARGCRAVVAAPLLLFAAGHARRDVPEALAVAAAAAGLDVVQAEPLGRHPDVVALSRRRRDEALAGRGTRLPPVSAAEAAVVFVGRGASDPSTPAQLHGLAAASLAGTAAETFRLGLGFVAAARPTLEEALAAAVTSAAPTVRLVVVQPHLLFRGHVEEQVAAAVGRWREARRDVEWVQVARLGADPLVARALVARAAQAAQAPPPAQETSGREIGSPRPA